jgi:hypothetical protein
MAIIITIPVFAQDIAIGLITPVRQVKRIASRQARARSL